MVKGFEQQEKEKNFTPSRLEYFAAASLTGLCANVGTNKWGGKETVIQAIEHAKVIIEELDKRAAKK